MAKRGGTLDRLDAPERSGLPEPGGLTEVDGQAEVEEAEVEDREFEEAEFEDWTTVWTCACGYGNVGRQRCIRCGKRAPAEAQEAGGLWMPDDRVAAVPSSRAGRKAGRTVAATIGANLAMQVVVAVYIVTHHVGLSAAVKLSLFTGLAYYTAVALWVLGRSIDLGLRPRTGRSTALVGAAEGFIVGGGLALLLVALLRLATGHPVLDPTAAVLAAQSSIVPLVIGFVVIAMLGPVVEELIFRGFLAEALRGRGRRTAVLVSAVFFSLAHLRLAQFRYYVAMGVVFGLVYWRRGLVGSVCAHAAFNGMLVIVALAAIHGPAQQIHTPAFTVTVPAAWTVAPHSPGDDLMADSPLGSRVELSHLDAPGIPDVAILARGLAGGAVTLPPQITIDYATVAVVDFPAGQAVAMTVHVGGYDGRVIMIPRGERMWMATLRSGGEASDMTAFHDMVRSWTF
jgi:membrane protease YdiL (CAAX protease family)